MRTKLKVVKKLVDDVDKSTKTALLQRVSYFGYLIFLQLLVTVLSQTAGCKKVELYGVKCKVLTETKFSWPTTN